MPAFLQSFLFLFLIWSFDTLAAVKNNFNNGFGSVNLSFTLSKTCAYTGEAITVQLSGETFCGKPIEIILTKPAPVFGAGGGLTKDTLSVDSLQCKQDSIRFHVDVKNSNGATNFANTIELALPPTYAFAASGNNNLTITLPAASHDSSITLSINRVNNFCASSADTVTLRIITTATVFCV